MNRVEPGRTRTPGGTGTRTSQLFKRPTRGSRFTPDLLSLVLACPQRWADVGLVGRCGREKGGGKRTSAQRPRITSGCLFLQRAVCVCHHWIPPEECPSASLSILEHDQNSSSVVQLEFLDSTLQRRTWSILATDAFGRHVPCLPHIHGSRRSRSTPSATRRAWASGPFWPRSPLGPLSPTRPMSSSGTLI